MIPATSFSWRSSLSLYLLLSTIIASRNITYAQNFKTLPTATSRRRHGNDRINSSSNHGSSAGTKRTTRIRGLKYNNNDDDNNEKRHRQMSLLSSKLRVQHDHPHYRQLQGIPMRMDRPPGFGSARCQSRPNLSATRGGSAGIAKAKGPALPPPSSSAPSEMPTTQVLLNNHCSTGNMGPHTVGEPVAIISSTSEFAPLGILPQCNGDGNDLSSTGVWYAFEGVGGFISIDTCNIETSISTSIAVYASIHDDASPCGTTLSSCVASGIRDKSIDETACFQREHLSFFTTSGTTYYVAVMGLIDLPNETRTIIDTLRRNYILDNARFGGSEFEDPTAYQSRAMSWVMSQDLPPPRNSSITREDQVLQLFALACIYYNTFSVRNEGTDFHFGGSPIPGWFSSAGWLQDPAEYCFWYGLKCDTIGFVSEIELHSNGLTGYFPPEAALLRENLVRLDLFNNIINNQGDLGNSFLGELTNLEYLFYGNTDFEYDGIPTEIGLLTKLKEYDCAYTLYFGELRGEVFKDLVNLNYLVLDGNVYLSPLPPELIILPDLEFLYVVNSFLEGDLGFIKDMPKIFELWVDDNQSLGGSLPVSIGEAQTLVSFSAHSCNLSGTIPTEIGQLTNMIQMWLFNNNLQGTIPTELARLTSMKILSLQENELIGDMPPEICSRRDPFGRLEHLEADCLAAITCDCCTCCGELCDWKG